MEFIKKYSLRFLIILFLSNILISCENDPSSVGITFIDPDDTTSTKVLDSQTDTMEITSDTYKYPINTYSSSAFMVGNYQNYTSKSMLKFLNISPDFDSSTIISAILTLRYTDYYFEEEKGLTSFNIFNMTTDFNYRNITFDSVDAENYGTVPQGSYTGTPADTQQINITLNNSLIKDWFEYAADTGYINKNYGIILLPNSGSNTIKGFYSFNNSLGLIPYTTIIYTKNGVLDTVLLNLSEEVSLSDAPYSIIPEDRFVVQSGIAYRNVLNFNLSKLPGNVIINNVNLTFYLDTKNSFISSTADKRISIGSVIDSSTHSDSLFVTASQLDSLTYQVSSTGLNAIFQRWNSGILPNLGISMRSNNESQNLDYFVFYSPQADDISLRPRIKITYTLRGQ